MSRKSPEDQDKGIDTLSRRDLIDSRQKYKDLVDNLPHRVFLKDKNGYYISCNKAYANDRRRPVNEIQGLTDYDLFPSYLATRYQERDQQVLQTDTKIEYEDYYSARDGYEIVKIILTPVHDDQNRTSGVLGVLWNITKEKQYENALVEKEKQFRRFVDKASDAITLADMNGKIAYANQKACDALGYTNAELTAAHMSDINPAIWSQHSPSPDLKKLTDEEAVIIESTYHCKDGTSFPVEISMGLHNEGERRLVLSIARDITPRHLALQHRASLGKIIEDSLNETYILLRDRLQFLQANRGARENIQFSADELKTKSIADICPELTGKIFQERVKPLADGSLDRISFETVFRRKDGSTYPASVFVQAAEYLFYPVYVIHALDNTVRREFEQKLQSAYEIINSSSSVVFIWEALEEWPIRYVSENVQNVFGYLPEEFSSREVTYARLIHPDDLDTYLAEVRNCSSRNILVHSPYRIITRSKEIKWVSEHTTIKRDEKGNIQFFQGIVEDITALKENEIALQRSKDQWERTFHAIPDIVALIDPELRITRINEAGCRQLGQPCEKLIGMHCHDLMEGSAMPCPDCPASDSLEEFQPYTKEVYHEKLRKTFLVTTSPVPNENHGIANIALVIKDITERKKLEEQLFQSEKLATIAGLAAGVAHEINTPLSAILQSIMVVRNSLDGSRPENRKAAAACGIDLDRANEYFRLMEIDYFLNGIRESAIKASKIITSLLDFSRPHKGDMKLVDLNELLDNAISLAQADYDLKKKYDILNFTIQREYDPALPPVMCVPMEIEQVILNLVKNAVQAVVDGGGRQKPLLILRTAREDGSVRIEVEDNGPGIDEEKQKHIFDPFYTTKEVGVGTGLGLSVSFAIIHDKHHGAIEVESAPGKGAKFIVKIPVDKTTDI
ncbi:MAG: PAS domain S-box protein [Desulfobulbaceae bacterium]